MWVGLILFGLLLIAGLGGITGRGVYDSRDPAYSLRLPDPKPRRTAALVDTDAETEDQ
jgi:hypothetical protein